MAGGIREHHGDELPENHEINVTPFIDVMHQEDNTLFELYLRQLGPGAHASQRMLKYVQNWDQAGRPTSLRWQIRTLPADTAYQPAADEFLVEKPWTKLIVRYQ